MNAQDTTDAPELTALMQPFLSLPVATPAMMMTFMNWMQGELSKLAERAEDGAAVKQEWATPTKIGKIYGFDRVTMAKHLAAWAAAGKVEVRQIFDEVTRAYGNRLYSLADVDKLMKATAAEGQPRGTKSKKGAA